MKRILTIWRDMTGAERAVLAAATLALAVTVVAAPFALLKRPDDVSNPDAAFAREEGAGKEKEPKPAKTVNWTRFGYDIGRSKFLDSPKVRPPFRKVWKYTGDELIEFPPIYVDDRLYFIDNDGVYVALEREHREGGLEEAARLAQRLLPRLLQGRPLQRQPLAAVRRWRSGPATARSSGASRSTAAPSHRRS